MSKRDTNITWVVRMAWRESRRHRKRLVMFIFSIALGISALVSVSAFRDNLRRAVDEQSKALIGADLVLKGRRPFSDAALALFDHIGGEQATEVSFTSMVTFPNAEGTKLVQVRAIDAGFPFYGTLRTIPENAVDQYRAGAFALVDENLLYQFDRKVGDSIALGKKTFTIAGALKHVPGQTFATATLASRVFIPRNQLDETGLITRGSLARYYQYVKLNPDVALPELLEEIGPVVRSEHLRTETLESRANKTTNALDNVAGFLNLTGFIALFLGSLGCASGVHTLLRQKMSSIATLRCLGTTADEIFAIFFTQVLVVSVIGSLAGAALGTAIQFALPAVFSGVINLPFEIQPSPTAVLTGMGVGIATSIAICLLALLTIRNISPLLSIRASAGEHSTVRRDKVRLAVILLVIIVVVLLSALQSNSWTSGVTFSGGLLVAVLLCIATAKALMRFGKALVAKSWPYVARQGLKNLYRPQNQTAVVIATLGLSTFLLLTLLFVRDTLLEQFSFSSDENSGNTVIFDIQADQQQALQALLQRQNFPILDVVPVVTMRLKDVNGTSAVDLLKSRKLPPWTVTREYRSTFRGDLRDSEEIIEGEWVPKIDSSTDVIPISLERSIANYLKVKLGEELTFDVQGVEVKTVIASIRAVDWQRIQPNFFVVFPNGAIDDAPAFNVVVTRIENPQRSAVLQRSVVEQFPNISIIDLTLVVETLAKVLDRASLILRFMALFSLIASVLVLAAALLATHQGRTAQVALLRTIGASWKQIVQITAIEFLFLGAFSVVTGLLLALVGSWLLANHVFKTEFYAAPGSAMFVLSTVVALTLATGWLVSRNVLHQPAIHALNRSN